MTKIIELTKFTAERIVFDDQDVETDWAYMRLDYGNDGAGRLFNWFKGSVEPFGFELVVDDAEDARLEEIYQQRLADKYEPLDDEGSAL